jgi:chemotaxis protein methyltransferase CheR
VLATARAASTRRRPGPVAERLKRHFMRGTGANSGHIRVKPELARLIEFRSLQPDEPELERLGEAFDLVFCRNVMIYFDAPRSARCSNACTGRSSPAGCCTWATRRTSPTSRDLFRLRGKTIYERL